MTLKIPRNMLNKYFMQKWCGTYEVKKYNCSSVGISLVWNAHFLMNRYVSSYKCATQRLCILEGFNWVSKMKPTKIIREELIGKSWCWAYSDGAS
jgi:hypothetical protein